MFIDSSKDVVARKLRLRRGGRQGEGAAADQDQAKILKGMQDTPNLPPQELKAQSLKLVAILSHHQHHVHYSFSTLTDRQTFQGYQ